MEQNKIVIGIDQSYTRTGITTLKDNLFIDSFSVNYPINDNTEKRKYLVQNLSEHMYYLDSITNNPHNIMVITERIRLFSGGHISQNYIKATSALVATIIDFFYDYDIPVYSVDTRAWKRAIVGTDKPLNNKYGIDPKKYPTILYLKKLGLLSEIVDKYEGKGKKGVINIKINGIKTPCKINDDIADSYCIAKCGFLPEEQRKQILKEERF